MPHRYFTTEISDGTAVLRGADAHHLSRVMRGRLGDTVILCDGSAVEYTATITGFGDETVEFSVEPGYPSAAEPTVDVTLLVGYPKQDKLEQVIRHAEGADKQRRVGTRAQHNRGGSAGQNKLPAKERRHPVFPRDFGHAVGAARRDGFHALRGDFRHFPVHVAAFVRVNARITQGLVKVRGDGRSVHTSPRQNKDTNAFQALMRFSV